MGISVAAFSISMQICIFPCLSQGKILGRWETANKSPIYNSDAVISNRAQNCPVPWYVNGCVMDEDLS